MRVAQSVVEVLSAQANDLNVTLLLENTSGQQAELGASLSELAQMYEAIMNQTSHGLRVGVCLDTAHAWGAGYDLARPRGQEEMLAEFDRVLGMENLSLIHFNDSLAALGSR
ncbi:MAG: TIM barrel protein, partial [Deltaproteobacteria bacterium]|nr:TIM barrel protein [Deltaproteobacteria bacterium]